MESKITAADLYSENIHGITFSLLPRAIGAKIYKPTSIEVRLCFDGDVKKTFISLEELKQFRDNVDFLYRTAVESKLAYEKEERESNLFTENMQPM